MKNIKEIKRTIRRKRIRKLIKGTTKRPRLVVFRSLKNISAQIIDDITKKTIVSTTSQEFNDLKQTKAQASEKVGELIAQKAIKKGIKEVVFDKAGYKYHGRVKALADSARKNGLSF